MNQIKKPEATQQLKPKLSSFNKEKYLKICFFIILFCISYLIFFEPFIGIANNGDFQRFSKKFGVDYAYDPWTAANYNKTFFNSVINNFIIVKPTSTGFFSSYEIVGWFSRALCGIFSKSGLYDIRFMGAACLVFYLFACGLLLYAVRDQSKPTVIITGILAIILSVDPYMVQFFNSFYSEMGMIIPLIFFIASYLLYVNSRKIFWLVAQIIFAVLAATAKSQNVVILLPSLILICCEIVYLHKEHYSGKNFFAMFLICLCTIVPTLMVLHANKGENVTCYSVIMQDILKDSKDPSAQLKSAGFTEEEVAELIPQVGKGAFDSDYYGNHPQETAKFTRKAEIQLLIQEPKTVFILISERAKNLFQNTPFGCFLAKEHLPYGKCKAFPLASYIVQALYLKSIWFYGTIILFSILISVHGFTKKQNRLLYSVWLYIATTNLIQYLAIIFGDGMEADDKHFFAVNVEFNVIYIMLICILLATIWNIVKKFLTKKNIHLVGITHKGGKLCTIRIVRNP